MRQPSAARDDVIPSLRAAISQVHQRSSKIFFQLHHPGRQGVSALIGGQPTVAPSAIEDTTTHEPVRALTTEETHDLVCDFVNAAVRIKKAGGDGVEIHAAHGYLVDQFLSPHSNHRDDEYGGSWENRTRFLRDILTGIRSACGADFPVSVRLSISECYDLIGRPGEGIETEEGVRNAVLAAELGAALISVSSGTYETMHTIIEPMGAPAGWRDTMIAAVREAVDIPVMGVSITRDPAQAEEMLRQGLVDLVAMGRSWLADPQWGIKAIQGRDEEITRCIGCMYCIDKVLAGEPVACALNPRCGFETQFPKVPEHNGAGRRGLVIGAGPAGCQAAETMALRGMQVDLYEAGSTIGGQVALGSVPSGKEPLDWLLSDYDRRLHEAGVTIHLDARADVDSVRGSGADAVVVATGAAPIMPSATEGIDRGNAVTCLDVLVGMAAVGQVAVVVGSGLTGLETARFLAQDGTRVTVCETADEIAPGAQPTLRADAMAALRELGVPMRTGHRLVSIGEASAVFVHDGQEVEIPADTVVLAIGMRPRARLSAELREAGIRATTVGDAVSIGRIGDAVQAGYRAGMMV